MEQLFSSCDQIQKLLQKLNNNNIRNKNKKKKKNKNKRKNMNNNNNTILLKEGKKKQVFLDGFSGLYHTTRRLEIDTFPIIVPLQFVLSISLKNSISSSPV
jgi:hypothetical protein